MKWFTIDGREWKVRVFEPEESFTILYSENTGRTLSAGAPMALDPLGTFYNYTMTIGAIQGAEDDFEALWEYLSFPRDEALLVNFPKSRNGYWQTESEGETVNGFYAYVSKGARKIKRIVEERNGELQDVIYEAFSVNFIATKAQVIPNE